MKTRVYIAGPISKGDLQHNIDQSREAFFKLTKAGFAPFNPVLSVFAESNTPSTGTTTLSHKQWLQVDLSWVACAQVVLRLPGFSVGADQEVEFATTAGIPIYHDINELIKNPPIRGSSLFHALLKEIGQLHDQKQKSGLGALSRGFTGGN